MLFVKFNVKCAFFDYFMLFLHFNDFIIVLQLKIIERSIIVITDIKAVVCVLLLVLFLTMVLINPSFIDFLLFILIFVFSVNVGLWN